MIQFRCNECQKMLQVPPEHAGKLAACPCGAHTRAPDASVDDVPVAQAITDFDSAPQYPPSPQPLSGDGFANPQAFGEQGMPYGGQPQGMAPAGENPYANYQETPGGYEQPPERVSPMNKKTFGGLAMMVGAVVWFFVGMAAGRIFIYPPILFILGLVGFVKGLTGKLD